MALTGTADLQAPAADQLQGVRLSHLPGLRHEARPEGRRARRLPVRERRGSGGPRRGRGAADPARRRGHRRAALRGGQRGGLVPPREDLLPPARPRRARAQRRGRARRTWPLASPATRSSASACSCASTAWRSTTPAAGRRRTRRRSPPPAPPLPACRSCCSPATPAAIEAALQGGAAAERPLVGRATTGHLPGHGRDGGTTRLPAADRRARTAISTGSPSSPSRRAPPGSRTSSSTPAAPAWPATSPPSPSSAASPSRRTCGRWATPSYAEARASSPLGELARAAQAIAKYAGVIVLDTDDPALVYPLLTLRQNIYSDPQKPIQVEPRALRDRRRRPRQPAARDDQLLAHLLLSLGRGRGQRPAGLAAGRRRRRPVGAHGLGRRQVRRREDRQDGQGRRASKAASTTASSCCPASSPVYPARSRRSSPAGRSWSARATRSTSRPTSGTSGAPEPPWPTPRHPRDQRAARPARRPSTRPDAARSLAAGPSRPRPAAARPRAVVVTFLPGGRMAEVPTGTSLLDAATVAGVEIAAPCGGQGRCGRCRVSVAGEGLERRRPRPPVGGRGRGRRRPRLPVVRRAAPSRSLCRRGAPSRCDRTATPSPSPKRCR